MDAVTEPLADIDLATEPDFQLGAAWISPSTCRVRVQGRDQRVEPRVMQVLITLARHQDHTVTRDQLVDACWGGRVVSNDAVNRVLAQVRNLSRAFDPAPFILETVPKVGFRLIPEGAGAAQAVAATPAEAASTPPAPGRWRLARRLLVGAAAAAVVVTLVALAWRTAWRGGAAPGGQSGRVEVVTFDVRGGDPELRRASADLGDALVRVLTRSGIDTVPKISGRGDGGPDVAELRVTGSIGRQGRDIVVDTQVLDRKTGLVLSSLQLTRPANAAAGFTDKIAVDVAAGLDCALEDRKRSRRAMDPTVFALYLNTCDSIVREGNAPRMLDSGRRLVEAAPRLAIGQALYAVAQAMSAKDLKHQPAEAAALQHGARASAALALTLDPQTPKAYLAIANSYPEGTNWAERERNLLKARQIDPNLNPGRMSYVTLLREVGRLDEALEVSQQLVASDDPRTLGYAEVPAILVSAQLGQMRSAHAFLEQLDRFDPDMARSVRWEVSSSWTAPAAALADLRAFGPQGQDPRTFACVQQFLGELPTRVAVHARGLPAACGGLPPERRVTMLAREGDVDGAYAEFAKVASEHAFLGFLFEPEMKSFRADARFMPLAARLGLTDYWMTSGHWPDFCAEPGLPYDCRAAAQALEAGSRT